jgi:hypothetical protein
MVERRFFESQALPAALAITHELLGLKPDPELVTQLPEDKAAHLNDALAQFFGDSRLADDITVASDLAAPASADGFGWKIGSKRDGAVTKKARFFRAKSVWKVQAASLIGISLAIALVPVNPFAPASAVGPLFTLLATAWDSFITLERPKDADAIDTYEALLKAELESPTSDRRGATATETHEHSSVSSFAKTLTALKYLRDIRLIDVVAWEDQAGNFDLPGNRWFQQF